jgi:hypothetical protein
MGHHVEIFTTQPPDSCICAICHDVFKDPICFKQYCGHTFCDECARDIRSCPTCRKEVNGTVPNFFARETIGALEVNCPTQFEDNQSSKRVRGNEGEAIPTSDGCGWVGKCESLHVHEKDCQFKLVTCEIEGCDHQCRRKDMANHISGDIVHHMKLMKDSADKKVESFKLSVAADYEKKMSGLKQAITSDYDKKIDSMDKKLKSADKEIKALKKKVSELEAKQSQGNLPSDEEEEDEGVKIKVEGCGTLEVNGTYKQDDMHHDKPEFIKEGRWDEEDVEFKIYYHDDTESWWISCYPDDGEFWQRHCHSEMQNFVNLFLCTESEVDFYRGRSVADLPPMDEWEIMDYGVYPQPRITVLGNDSE